MTRETTPWKRKAPKNASHTALTPAGKRKARSAAAKAGRRYPNLVDNMHAAQKQQQRERKK